ncbi:MAG: iron complex outermembrane receptor protein [Candidatus Azotimanducaceae bacterium]
MRTGGDYGYKTPNLFVSEADELQYRGITPIDPDLHVAEKSSGLNVDLNHRVEFAESWSLTSNVLLFYMQISNPPSIAEQSPGLFTFTQQNGDTKASGVELNLIFGFSELRYFLGYTFVNASEETNAGDQYLALVSQHRVNNVLVWEREDDSRIGLEAYYFSSQRRAGDTSGKSYWIYGLMAEKKLGKTVTAFLNFENFTDTRQTRFENVNTGTLQSPQLIDIYAPLDGFVVNGGFRTQW